MTDEFVMPGGMYSGRRYSVLTPQEYVNYLPKLEGSISIAYINNFRLERLSDMAEMMSDLRALHAMVVKHKRDDTITLVTYKPIIWEWLVPLMFDQVINHTVFITDRGHYNFDEVRPLPVTEIMLIVDDIRDFIMVNKLPKKANIVSSILVDSAKVHWALGGLSTSGRPDICLYVNLQTITPDPRGASI